MTQPASTAPVPRYVQLIRVSSKKQADADTPEAQRRALDALKEHRPGVLVGCIEDGAAGLSGALGLADRPDLQKLAELAQQRAFDEVRVYDLDRLTRSDDLRERAAVYEMVREAGAIIVDRHGNETNPADESGMGELGYYLRTFFAAQERRKIKDRSMDGRKRTAAAGHKPQGGTPFGLTYDAETKSWGIHEQHAQIVRSIYEWAAAGLSVTAIAKKLGDAGVPAPSGGSKWNRSRIHEFLRDTAYRGEKVYTLGGESFAMTVPAIIDRRVWDAVQAALTRRNRVPVRGEYTHPALLRQRAVCGKCGAPLHVDCSQNREAYRKRYKCSSKARGAKCGALTHQIAAVDGALWSAVSQALRDPKWLERAIQHQRTKSARGEWESQIKSCEKKLAEIAKAEQSVLGFLADGLSESACRERLQVLAKQRDTAQRSLDLAERALASRHEEHEAMARMEAEMARLREKLGSDDFAVRDSVIAALTPLDGPLATIHDDGTIELHGILSFDSATPAAHGGELSAAARRGGFPRAGSTRPRWGYRCGR